VLAPSIWRVNTADSTRVKARRAPRPVPSRRRPAASKPPLPLRQSAASHQAAHTPPVFLSGSTRGRAHISTAAGRRRGGRRAAAVVFGVSP
jgi:hypothetical protein